MARGRVTAAIAAAAGLVLASAAPAAAQAQASFEFRWSSQSGTSWGGQRGSQRIDYVLETLQALADQLDRTHYSGTLLLDQGNMAAGQTLGYTVTPPQDSSGQVRVMATCDRDCGDIDVWVHDAYTGELVAQDMDPDATPSLNFHPQWGRSYTVTVSLYACTTPYCYFAVAVVR